MLRKASYFTLFLLTCILSLWTWSFARFDETDLAIMRQRALVKKQERSMPVFSTTTQNRKGVVKDIFFSQEEGPRLHHRILSDTSTLYLIPQGKHFDLVEQLQGVQCWMQDKLYSSTSVAAQEQQVRFLKAYEGFYRYSAQEFLAQSVSLSLYRLPGIDLPKDLPSTLDPFLNGMAQDVSFSFSGKTPQFKAEHFKAILPPLSSKEGSL